MSRLRIERRRLADPAANGRLRRDPRTERLGTPVPQAAATETGPSGRIRRDPRAGRHADDAGIGERIAEKALHQRA